MPRVEVPFGPYHPALGEPEYFKVVLEGEKIVSVDFELGYNYREIEKKAAMFTWPKALVLLGRICGICSSAHTQAFAYSVEKINGIEIPNRAKYIRTIGAELERLHSHLLWFGLQGDQAGFDTLFMHAWGAREHALNMLEIMAGKRIHYNYMIIGGVHRDIPPTIANQMKKELIELTKKYETTKEIFLSNEVMIDRLKIAKLTTEKAREFGVVGPVARGSGIKMDARKDFPYSAYEELDFKIPIQKGGDAYARSLVRLDEMNESILMLNQLLSNLPKGKISKQGLFLKSKEGEKTTVIEAPRGENFHFVIAGKNTPKFVRVRPPTFANLSAIPHMMKGLSLSDVPLVISSIDPCFACTDRVIVMDLNSKTIKEVEM